MEVENQNMQVCPQGISIYTCFDMFKNWETLDENNLWHCNQCTDLVQASKKIELFKCPPILNYSLKKV